MSLRGELVDVEVYPDIVYVRLIGSKPWKRNTENSAKTNSDGLLASCRNCSERMARSKSSCTRSLISRDRTSRCPLPEIS